MELALPASTTTPAFTDCTEIELWASDSSAFRVFSTCFFRTASEAFTVFCRLSGTTWSRLRTSFTPEI